MKQASQGVLAMFDYVTMQMRITIGGRNVYLNHLPFLVFPHWDPNMYKGLATEYALSGHTHIRANDTGSDSTFTDLYKSTQYDVGVDFNNYKPVSWETVNERIQYQINNNCNLKHWINES